MTVTRVVTALAGVGLLLYGVFRLLTEVEFGQLLGLAGWLVAAVVVHDGLVAPLTVGVGGLLTRLVADRARRYLQAFLTATALVTVVAVPLILRQGTRPAVKAQLTQDYPAHLALIVGLLAAACLTAYGVRVVRDRYRPAAVSDAGGSGAAAAEPRPR